MIRPDEWEYLRRASADERRAFARERGIKYHSLRARLSERRHAGGDAMRHTSLPAAVELIARPPLVVPLRSFVYAADFHCPLHSQLMIRRLMAVAEREQLDTLVIGGDMLDFDSASAHGRAELQAGLTRTIETAGAVLDALCEYVRRIYLLPGNHDARVAKRLDEPLSFELLIRAGVKRARVSGDATSDAEIITTDNEWLHIGSEETGWVVGHPLRYARTPVRLSAAAMRERRNVLAAHTHLQSLLWSDDGRYCIVEPGHMTDPRLTPYLVRTQGLSTFASWRAGFVTVKDNRPVLYGDGLTDWRQYTI